MTKKEQENVLTKEIESWISSEYSLREQDRILFNKIVNECQKESIVKHKPLKTNTTLLNHCLWL
jgi:hypothetical protein